MHKPGLQVYARHPCLGEQPPPLPFPSLTHLPSFSFCSFLIPSFFFFLYLSPTVSSICFILQTNMGAHSVPDTCWGSEVNYIRSLPLRILHSGEISWVAQTLEEFMFSLVLWLSPHCSPRAATHAHTHSAQGKPGNAQITTGILWQIWASRLQITGQGFPLALPAPVSFCPKPKLYIHECLHSANVS